MTRLFGVVLLTAKEYEAMQKRLSAFEQKAQKDFQTRSNAQKGRKKNTGAQP